MQKIAWLIVLWIGILPVQTYGYSDLIVFGDSLSDVGNVLQKTFGFAAADPYENGRLTNGGNYVDYLSPLLGLEAPVHSADGGSNYAHGGAQIRLGSSIFVNSLEVQKSDYLDDTSGVADPDALFIVYGGGNDMRDAGVNPGSAAADLVSIVSNLLDAGAMSVVVPNLPDLGMTPEVAEYGQGAGAASTARTLQFNAAMQGGLDQLDADDRIIRFDVFGQLNAIVEDAATGGLQFGITNVADDCWEGGPNGLGTGDPLFGAAYPKCSQPDSYLFWDVIHPTTAAHEVLAKQLYEQLTVTADGDFNGDGEWNCLDVDELVAAIVDGSSPAGFDLTGDGIVDPDDLSEWRAAAGDVNLGPGLLYLVGDANLDGGVDTEDFNIWNSNKFSHSAAWCSADFNADGVTDVSDFNLWNENRFQSSFPTVAVPEPVSMVLWLSLVPVLSGRGRAEATSHCPNRRTSIGC